MSKNKKLTIIIAAAALIVIIGIVLAVLFLGDDGSDGYMSLDTYKVSDQHYTYFCTKGYDAAYQATGIGDSSLWDAEIDGVKTEKWIKEYAIEEAKRFLVINKMFEEAELSFTQDELFAIDDEVENAWLYTGISRAYEKMGITQLVYEDIVTTEKKAEKLAEYYAEELSQSISEDDIKAYLADNYASVLYFAMSYVNAESDSTLEEYEGYCEEVENGKSLEKLIKELDASGNEFIVTSVGADRNDLIITRKGSGYPIEYVDALFSAENGDIVPFDDTAANIYVLSQKLDILADDYYLNLYRDEVVNALLAARYEDKIQDEMDSYTIDSAKMAINGMDLEEMYS